MWKIIKYVRLILSCQLILATSRIHVTGQLHEKYVGCFIDDGAYQELQPVSRNQSNLTIETCIQKCYNESNKTKLQTTLAALFNGSRCVCRNDSGQQLPDLNCNVKCSGDQMQVCGGNASDRIYSLYTVCRVGSFGQNCVQLCHCKRHLPCDRITGVCPNGCDENWTGTSCNISNVPKQYKGCYGDGPESQQKQAMDVKNPGGTTGVSKVTNSIKFCLKICSSYNYTYAGMQYGYDCNCGEQYSRYGNKTHDGRQINCSFPCKANGNQKCGGDFANSVYFVCPFGFYGRSCVNRCQCNGDPCRFNGSCITSNFSLCKPRWTGSACNIIVNDILWCSNDTDCKPNEDCNLINLIYTNVSRCRCKQGFHRMNISAQCTDVNECQSGSSTCNLESENCFNNIGNYRCDCKDGFVNMSGKCEDIDECGNQSLLCEAETELCKNTIGSYTCNCKFGYENTTFGNCTDVDECQSGYSTCNPDSENCFNNIGNYRCECKDGFVNMSGVCDDIDECGNESLLCHTETEFCRNTIGSYTCACMSGYEKTTVANCTDVDECQLHWPSSPCNSTSERCINGIGNYMCICKEGFTSIFSKCIEFSGTTTTGIILGTIVTISLLVNAILIVSRVKSTKSIKPDKQNESEENMAQSDFEMKYDEIPSRVGQNSMYEEIITGQRELVLCETSDYAELRPISYVNVASPI